MTVSWLTFGLTRKRKKMELPDGVINVRAEFGGFYNDDGIYVWWNEKGIDKCKKIVTTKWRMNMNHLSFKIEQP